MGMFDYFVGKLKCPVCSKISNADSSTGMQTKIRKKPQLEELSVGEPLVVSFEDMKNAGYYKISLPQTNEQICILDMWECPFCGSPRNWAKIVINDEVIQEISSVSKTKEVLENAHFLSDECVYDLEVLTNIPFQELIQADLLKIIRENPI